jgi:hypothetical protein
MISAYSREGRLPLSLSLMAEQLFKFAASAARDLSDDTSLIKLYVPQETYQENDVVISVEDIEILLFGIHTAAGLEAISFATNLDAHWPSLADIVRGAAGASKAWETLLDDIGEDEPPKVPGQETLAAMGAKMVSCQPSKTSTGIADWISRL